MTSRVGTRKSRARGQEIWCLCRRGSLILKQRESVTVSHSRIPLVKNWKDTRSEPVVNHPSNGIVSLAEPPHTIYPLCKQVYYIHVYYTSNAYSGGNIRASVTSTYIGNTSTACFTASTYGSFPPNKPLYMNINSCDKSARQASPKYAGIHVT